jgi:hypothetical protein
MAAVGPVWQLEERQKRQTKFFELVEKTWERNKKVKPDIIEREVEEDQGGFRSRVIGKVRAGLPRKRPGRRGSPEVRRAAEIYVRDFKSKGQEGDWHVITRQVIPGYSEMRPEIQRLHRISLRANVHSLLYEERSRQRRRKGRLEGKMNSNKMGASAIDCW